MKLAIVIPIYNERENLPEVYRRVAAACEKLVVSQWQMIYVDDGSTDDSLAVIGQQVLADSRVICVELSRNFGHQAATLAGLTVAEADGVIMMDGDLQDPPSCSLRQTRPLRRDAADVAYSPIKNRFAPRSKP